MSRNNAYTSSDMGENYLPMQNSTNGGNMVFPMYKQNAGSTFTDWRSAGQTVGGLQQQTGVINNNNIQQRLGTKMINTENKNGAFTSQTAAIQKGTQGCSICGGKMICNANRGPSTVMNQSYPKCVQGSYPEMDLPNAMNAAQREKYGIKGRGPIAISRKACSKDSDCPFQELNNDARIDGGMGVGCMTESNAFGGVNGLGQQGYCSPFITETDFQGKKQRNYLNYPYDAPMPRQQDMLDQTNPRLQDFKPVPCVNNRCEDAGLECVPTVNEAGQQENYCLKPVFHSADPIYRQNFNPVAPLVTSGGPELIGAGFQYNVPSAFGPGGLNTEFLKEFGASAGGVTPASQGKVDNFHVY